VELAKGRKVRILHCNWVSPDDPAGRGGGVRVYVRSLIAAQQATGRHAPSAISAGMAYDLSAAAKPAWRRVGADRYACVNTYPIAPSHADFASRAQITHAPTEAAFRDFIMKTGPYDVIHFHGLEGFPARVLALKAELPQTRFVLSLHNYYLFCPQVNLWWQERAHCADFDNGARCATCLPVVLNPMAVRRAYAVETAFARLGMPPGSWGYDRVLRPVLTGGWRALKALRKSRPMAAAARPEAAGFAQRRAQMVALVNTHCDAVLAVSDRVRVLAQEFGLEKVQTCYIGTDHAKAWAETVPRPVGHGPLRLGYLGYMRPDKGFDFLLDALHALPDTLLARLHLVVAARKGSAAMMRKMRALEPRLAGLTWHDGYTTAALDSILSQVDVGIVPPLWEDNLPQVALEMHARHLPLITSDRGGAQELPGTSELVFRAGDKADFARVVSLLLDGRANMHAYWAGARPPQNMHDHAAQLDAIYAGT
jgi:glycosyltransferase involved in cell wall biosynthesis